MSIQYGIPYPHSSGSRLDFTAELDRVARESESERWVCLGVGGQAAIVVLVDADDATSEGPTMEAVSLFMVETDECEERLLGILYLNRGTECNGIGLKHMRSMPIERLPRTSEVKASVSNPTSKVPDQGVIITIDVPVLTRSRPTYSKSR